MINKSSWDFRDDLELNMSAVYSTEGFYIADGDSEYLGLLKDSIESAFHNFLKINTKPTTCLENAHKVISNEESNDLRIYIIKEISKSTELHRYYYNAAKKVIHCLCGNELAMQKRPGLSVNLPGNISDVLPIHADTWNGVSPFELNIWIPLVNCSDSMSLYILKRDAYQKKLKETGGLLKLTSDALFNELSDDLTWIPVEYGQILAFDQSLPHGYSLNTEELTHWSMNCRFKGLHTPYWDKKLGEYFMPITVKNCTRIGMQYEHPKQWI
jgi:sporadic carbohydrate cluster 2OG-Fe(II) oxygenase